MANRYQREIEEILGQANEEASGADAESVGKAKPAGRRMRPPRSRRSPRSSLHVTPGRLLRAGLAALAAALLLTILGVGVATPFAWLGVALIIIAYVTFFIQPRRTVERRWRGQPLDDPPEPGPLSQLWRWITRG